MPALEIAFWIDDRNDVATYTVDGELKRPGEAIQTAREEASDDGHEELNLKEVRLAEPAQHP